MLGKINIVGEKAYTLNRCSAGRKPASKAPARWKIGAKPLRSSSRCSPYDQEAEDRRSSQGPSSGRNDLIARAVKKLKALYGAAPDNEDD